MRRYKKKELLRKGQVPIGAWSDLSDPHVVELAGHVGFDFIVLECEHTSRDLSQIEQLIYAADAAQMPVLVRIRDLSTDLIVRILAAGAMGVLLSQTQTKEDAVKLVEATKYPPLGRRGMHPTIRATQFSFNLGGPELVEYTKVANEETMVMVIIEDRLGVDNIDEILSVDGIDGVNFGPVDLALDYGCLDQWRDHPKMLAARDKVIKACRDHNKVIWEFVVNPEDIADLIKKGVNGIFFAHDIILLRILYEKSLKTMRAIVNDLCP